MADPYLAAEAAYDASCLLIDQTEDMEDQVNAQLDEVSEELVECETVVANSLMDQTNPKTGRTYSWTAAVDAAKTSEEYLSLVETRKQLRSQLREIERRLGKLRRAHHKATCRLRRESFTAVSV